MLHIQILVHHGVQRSNIAMLLSAIFVVCTHLVVILVAGRSSALSVFMRVPIFISNSLLFVRLVVVVAVSKLVLHRVVGVQVVTFGSFGSFLIVLLLLLPNVCTHVLMCTAVPALAALPVDPVGPDSG